MHARLGQSMMLEFDEFGVDDESIIGEDFLVRRSRVGVGVGVKIRVMIRPWIEIKSVERGIAEN